MELKTGRIIKKNVQELIKEIKQHSSEPQRVQIIAVTKTYNSTAIESAIKNNIFIIGENKVQETKQKLQTYKKPQKLKIHMIGHLQTNKAQEAVKLYDVIETVDSIKLAKALNRAANNNNKQQDIYIQVNISRNKNQHGAKPEDLKKLILNILELKKLNILGIMAIGANTTNKETIKKTYVELQQIKEKTEKETKIIFKETSLGMSGDYIQALEAGATQIRIGTKLFGVRLC